MENKRDELTAIDALNDVNKQLYRILAISESLDTLGMERAANILFDSVEKIGYCLETARGDISQSISDRYNQSVSQMGDILKACLDRGETK